MAEIDDILRDALPRLARAAAPPTATDTTSVADLIRVRVAAGDEGCIVLGTTAPGWRGHGFTSILASAGAILGAGAVGTAMGLSALLGSGDPVQEAAPAPATTAQPDAARPAAPAASESPIPTSPGEPTDAPAEPGADATRAPAAPAAPAAPQPPAASPSAPAEAPPTARAPAPQIVGHAASPSPAYNDEPVTIVVQTLDGVPVSQVLITLPGGQTTAMSGSGASWSYEWRGPASHGLGTVTFTMVAQGAHGAASAPVSVSVTHLFFG